MFSSNLKTFLIILGWPLILLLGFAVYSPGLHGPFIFDDYPNLRSLGLYGGVTDWDTFQSFVLGGFSGPTGRPISLLTFLLDANNWPTEPYSFKYTNVLIHLLNGTLVFAITLQILKLRCSHSDEARNAAIALVLAGLWTLHPYLVSTTLYVVQRMAMLSAMFCFAGIWLYLHGRFLVSTNNFRAYGYMTLGIGLGTVLATYSKENGAVLALLILCIECTVLAANNRLHALNPLWKCCALIVPSIALCFLLLKGPMANGWMQDFGTRDFSPYERVLTQFRVVLSYLYSWFAPSSSGGGLFYDDLEVSEGFLSPISTLISGLIVIGLITVAIIKRRQWPVFAFAVLFYFSSLAIESTTLNLEMKFDHRIYLGSIFIFLPIALAIAEKLRPSMRVSVSVILLALMAGLTFSSASLWGNYQQLTMVWAEKKPFSVRSQTEAGQMLFSSNQVLESRNLLDQAAERIPNDFRLRLTQVLVQCKSGGVEHEDLDAVKRLARTGPYRHTDFYLLNSLLTSADDPGCQGVNLNDADEITESLLESSSYTSPRSLAYGQLHYYRGLVLLKTGHNDEAEEVLDRALESRSSLHMRMNIAAYKASAGLLKQALKEAKFVRDRLRSGEVTGKAAVESPQLSDVEHFIEVVERDLAELGPTSSVETNKNTVLE